MAQARLKTLAAMTVLAGTASCASYLPVDASGGRTASPQTRDVSAPAARTSRAALGAGNKAPAESDTCGAGALAYMIGRPRAELPVSVDLSHRRVVCSTCSVTGPAQVDRQTILYDPATQRIVAVTCG